MESSSVERISYRGWQAVRLRTGLLEAVVVPDVGGRIMAFNMDGHPYLWVNPSLEGKLFTPEENQGDGTLGAWKNYGGSKTWPAPQGWSTEEEWHGPPDAVLDTGQYHLEECGLQGEEPFARVVSPADPRTGARITRQITLHPGAARATLHLEMENTSNHPRRWGIWDVVQMDAVRAIEGETPHDEDAWVYIPANPQSVFPGGYKVMFGAVENPEWQRDVAPGIIGAQYLFQVGKIGVDSPAGWVAFSNLRTGFTFVQRFPVFPEETYPDGGTTVACWTTGLGESVPGLDYSRDPLYHMEAEVVGPLREMQPGEHQSLEIEWCACRCPGPIRRVTGAGCVHQPLSIQHEGQMAFLRGVFGVFAPGTIRLGWQDEQGRTLQSEMVARAHPMDMLHLDLARVPPAGARRAVLTLVEESGTENLLDWVEYGG